MVNSIRYFEENCIKRFEKLEDDFLKEPTKIAEYVMGITDELHQLGLRMIQESLESMNQMLLDSIIRKENWVVESHTKKQLVTSLGTVLFKKTLFTNKSTGKSEYLLDRIAGFEPNQRITEDAEAKMLTEAVQTSYRRGGEETSLTTTVEKQTVKNKIHRLEFPEAEAPEQKKEVEYLYVEADEDHISLQYNQKKGDLKVNERNQKDNGMIAKLVYVHEGIEPEAPKSKRNRLVNPYYFSSTSYGEDNQEFWGTVEKYIEANYDTDKIKKIYLNADGGSWIKRGMRNLGKVTYVLDEFHIEKSLTKLTSHMKDSKEDARAELRTAIREQTKKEFEKIVERLIAELPEWKSEERMRKEAEYIQANWTAAKLRLKHKDGVIGSSTEGHVSHILSGRMSSRPMGWSRQGATKMCQLRAYYENGRDMLKLVRYQKKELPKAAGSECDILSAADIMVSEKNRHGAVGKYLEAMTHSMSLQNKKIVYFNEHIWGL